MESGLQGRASLEFQRTGAQLILPRANIVSLTHAGDPSSHARTYLSGCSTSCPPAPPPPPAPSPCSCFTSPPLTHNAAVNPNDYCSPSLSNTLTYTQVAGIIFGQLTIGFLCDRIGRKWCSVMNAAIMLVCESQSADCGDEPPP